MAPPVTPAPRRMSAREPSPEMPPVALTPPAAPLPQQALRGFVSAPTSAYRARAQRVPGASRVPRSSAVPAEFEWQDLGAQRQGLAQTEMGHDATNMGSPPEMPVPMSMDPEPAPPRQRRAAPKSHATRAAGRTTPAAFAGHFPVLSYQSEDVAFSTLRAVHGRMVTWSWARLLWMLRYQQARVQSHQRFRRPYRWLTQYFGAELASLWGHMGSAVRTVRGPRGLDLM